MGESCGTYGGHNKYIQSSGEEIRKKKKTLGIPKRSLQNIIRRGIAVRK